MTTVTQIPTQYIDELTVYDEALDAWKAGDKELYADLARGLTDDQRRHIEGAGNAI